MQHLLNFTKRKNHHTSAKRNAISEDNVRLVSVGQTAVATPNPEPNQIPKNPNPVLTRVRKAEKSCVVMMSHSLNTYPNLNFYMSANLLLLFLTFCMVHPSTEPSTLNEILKSVAVYWQKPKQMTNAPFYDYKHT